MRAGYDDNWYPGCDDSSEENEPDVDECNTLNYDDFLYPNECSPSNQAQCEEYDDDESNFGRPYNSPQRQCCSSGSSGWPAARDDTRIMRNLAIVNHDISRRDLSALEKPNSLSSWNHDDRTLGSMTYSDQQGQYLAEDYSDYPQPRRQQRHTPRVSRVTGLQTMVENLIYGTKVVIFSKTTCPYCITAKEIFDYMKQPYTTVELNRRPDGDQIQEIMGKITGGTSVPRVFINGIFIGGGDDVKRLYESGELEEMLDLE